MLVGSGEEDGETAPFAGFAGAKLVGQGHAEGLLDARVEDVLVGC